MTITYPIPGGATAVPGGTGSFQIDAISGQAVAVGDGARAEIKYYGDIIVRYDSAEDLPPQPGEPPYKGLMAYTDAPADVANFFGRERLGDALAARALSSRFVALVGASGSGKSSLLRAGLVPRLRARNWLAHVITPAGQPLERLATSLTRDDPSLSAAPDLRRALAADPSALRLAAEKLVARADALGLLLVVDQFEELFTLCHDLQERQQFVEALLAAGASSAIAVVLGLRADFTGRLTDYEALRAHSAANLELLGPMTQEELVRVVAEPARRGGWKLGQDLIEQILSDVGDEPGRLPLLSHALREMWERRSGPIMTLRGYRQAGGVEGAIAATAEQTYGALPPDSQALVRDIFLSLTAAGEAGPDTRRVAPRAELDALGEPAAVAAALETLADARLISLDRDAAQVAHEALIRRWPRLRDWIDAARETLLFRQELSRMMALWRANGEHADFLPRRGELVYIEERLRADNRPPAADALRFVEAAHRAEAAELVEEEGRSDRTRQSVRRELPFVMVGGAVGLSVIGYLIYTRWLEATSGVSSIVGWMAILGAFAGLLYAPIFDWVIGPAGRPVRRWSAAALMGFVTFGLILCALNLILPSKLGPVFLVGGVWGVVAGLGRVWSAGRPARLAVVALAGGMTLTALYGGAALHDGMGLWGGELSQPSMAWIALAGALPPLSILFAEWVSQREMGLFRTRPFSGQGAK